MDTAVSIEGVQQIFPLTVEATLSLSGQTISRSILLNSGLTVVLGPNGSGKTQLLRGFIPGLSTAAGGKKVRFISAGRIGLMEQYRSNFDGHRTIPQYDQDSHGTPTDARRRHLFETLNGDYQTLAARPDILLKVRERLKKLFKRNISLEWNQGSLRVFFTRTGDGTSYPASREASGLVHLAGLLAALYDDEVGALLLDEPEVSLHPQLQAFLLREIQTVSGLPGTGANKKLIILSTHSTEFLRIDSPADLTNLVFCYDLGQDPIQISANAGELKSAKVAELISRMGQEHKLSFFARSPLLVEGPSDTIICAGLANKFDIHIEAGGSQLLPVIGKGQFPVVVKLLRLLGKQPLVLADADAFIDGSDLAGAFLNTESADDRAAAVGHGTAMKFFSDVYRDFCAAVRHDWGTIRPFAETTPYWVTTADPTEEMKRRAAFVAVLRDTEGLPKAWLALKGRLIALLDLLETEGCFILRKGTIESYYSLAQDKNSTGKPTAATEEVIAFRSKGESEIANRYDDVLRCLRRAAGNEKICEAESVQDLLLAAAAPAFARIRSQPEAGDLNAIMRGNLGPAADLFDLRSEEGKLMIALRSDILEVPGFPMEISSEDDLITKVSGNLGLDSKKKPVDR
ncbi:AAA family ATPase [Sinorhizobium meliloti]|nr:AAA family ATPase [Sinorhizobium meliloti]MDW9980016.1 AAA family ATPase [Sinorhizobium meliloti]MDX0296594.1 AAA family ATPase [Sinorhizobium meliloti]